MAAKLFVYYDLTFCQQTLDFDVMGDILLMCIQAVQAGCNQFNIIMLH